MKTAMMKLFDSGYDLDIILDSENEGDSESSNLDIQIESLRLQKSNKGLCVRKECFELYHTQ